MYHTVNFENYFAWLYQYQRVTKHICSKNQKLRMLHVRGQVADSKHATRPEFCKTTSSETVIEATSVAKLMSLNA